MVKNLLYESFSELKNTQYTVYATNFFEDYINRIIANYYFEKLY